MNNEAKPQFGCQEPVPLFAKLHEPEQSCFNDEDKAIGQRARAQVQLLVIFVDAVVKDLSHRDS